MLRIVSIVRSSRPCNPLVAQRHISKMMFGESTTAFVPVWCFKLQSQPTNTGKIWQSLSSEAEIKSTLATLRSTKTTTTPTCAKQPNGSSTTVSGMWIHLDVSLPQHREWLQNDSGIDADGVIDKILDPEGVRALPKCELLTPIPDFDDSESDDDLFKTLDCLKPDQKDKTGWFIDLRGAEPGFCERDGWRKLEYIRTWAERSGLVVTSSHGNDTLLTELKDAIERGRGPRSVNQLCLAIVTNLGRAIAKLLSKLETRMTSIEEILCQFYHSAHTPKLKLIRADLSIIRQRVLSLRRFVAPQQIALKSLDRTMTRLHDHSSDMFVINHDTLRAINSETDHYEGFVSALDSLQARGKIAQEELLQLSSDQTSRWMYYLAVVNLIFLPLAALANIEGVFHMNVAKVVRALIEADTRKDDPNEYPY